MKKLLSVFGVSSLLCVGAFAQAPAKVTGERDRAVTKTSKADVSYGRIKELDSGKKVVVDVANAVDKSFDMTDKDTHVSMGKGLKVGDPVKVTEHKVNGVNRVMIAKDMSHDVKHGAKDRPTEVKDSPNNKK